MLAANEKTRQLLDGLAGTSVQEFADRHSAESIRRFSDRMSRRYVPAGLRVEYDGKVLRCVASRDHSLNERASRYEQEIVRIDPLQKGHSAWIQNEIKGNVVWWYDLLALQTHYRDVKSRVTSLVVDERERLENVPVVLGGDWEFNAWACPAGDYGDFIMVNWGFVHSYSYAAMFMEILDEARQATEVGNASGIFTSSMIWAAATSLGYEAFQWDNLSLPPNECDKIWESLQRPSERLASAIALMDAFTMLHECGHIAKGHLKALRDWKTEDFLNTDEREDRYRQMRAFEFEADAFACQALRSLNKNGGGCFEPLLILFSMLRLCEDRTVPTLTATHPNAAARFRGCLEALGENADSGVRLLERFAEVATNAAKSRLQWQATTHEK
jgi:hypothetical protein